ncbi:MAG: RNA polymerase sigma-G factor, partial [Oscillospiraceae bacterium]|nr:RNA polymerase sigma-G factor [Oscillospiraceae bacterium]
MQGKVEISCVNTAKLPLLSSKETETLLRQARDGDHAARERLIHGNLRLVLSVIQRFLGRGENADDLFQVGCIGLMTPITKLDPAPAVKFTTYDVTMNAGE